MAKFRNIVLAIISSVVFCSVILYTALGALFPFEVKVANVSVLEGRTYEAFQDALSQPIDTGEMQDAFESAAADHVPFRKAVMLGNATLQRLGIKTAAAVAGYSMYPTFFGSDKIVDTKDKIILPALEAAPTESLYLDIWLKTLNDAAQAHPEIRFHYTVVQEKKQTAESPLRPLTSGDIIDTQWIQSNITERLDPSISNYVSTIDSPTEIKKKWYSTDAHWTIERALECYDDMAEEMGWKKYEYKGAKKIVSKWYGEYARGGLDLVYPSSLWDVPTDFSQLEHHKIDKNCNVASDKTTLRREKILAGKSKKSVVNLAPAYTRYYGNGNWAVINKGPNNGKTCLLVGDSFTYSLRRYIASNYERCIVILPGNGLVNLSLEQVIERFDPDDVVYLTQPKKYSPIVKTSPRFVGYDKTPVDDADTGE